MLRWGVGKFQAQLKNRSKPDALAVLVVKSSGRMTEQPLQEKVLNVTETPGEA